MHRAAGVHVGVRVWESQGKPLRFTLDSPWRTPVPCTDLKIMHSACGMHMHAHDCHRSIPMLAHRTYQERNQHMHQTQTHGGCDVHVPDVYVPSLAKAQARGPGSECGCTRMWHPAGTRAAALLAMHRKAPVASGARQNRNSCQKQGFLFRAGTLSVRPALLEI